MTTSKDYMAKAADALVQLGESKNEAERTRLRRAHGVYLRLSRHEAEAAERAAAGPPPKIKPEKPKAAQGAMPRYFGTR